jgi:hypothetical protein
LFLYHVKLEAPVAEAVRDTVAFGQELFESPVIDALATAVCTVMARVAEPLGAAQAEVVTIFTQ